MECEKGNKVEELKKTCKIIYEGLERQKEVQREKRQKRQKICVRLNASSGPWS